MFHQLSSIFTKLRPYLPSKGDRTPLTKVRLSGFFSLPPHLRAPQSLSLQEIYVGDKSTKRWFKLGILFLKIFRPHWEALFKGYL